MNALQGQQFSYSQSENAALSYVMNWAGVLQSGTISISTWECNESLTIAATANTTTTATARLSGEPGHYRIVNRIVTASGDTDERIILLTITDNNGYRVGDYE
jgi:hypothetical protein